MVVNRHLISDSEIKNRLANVNYFLIELINYIVIFINNCFVIYHFYKSPYLPIENYDIFDEKEKDILHFDNIIISIAQAAILSFFIKASAAGLPPLIPKETTPHPPFGIYFLAIS